MSLFLMNHLVMSEQKFGYDKGGGVFSGLRLAMLLKNPTVHAAATPSLPQQRGTQPELSVVSTLRQMTPPLLRVTLSLAIHPAHPLRVSSSAIPFILLFNFLITCYVEAIDKSKINRI